MSNFLDNIKLIASDLANMSPKTQLEIVKLCKNLCLNVKDYLVELDETTLVNITTRLDNLEDEMTTAEGNIQANANAIDTINDAIDTINDALNNRYTKAEMDALLTSKLNTNIIVLTGTSGTLTASQIADIISGQNIILSRDNVLYVKAFENDTMSKFERLNFSRSWVDGVITTVREEINITKSNADWQYTRVIDIKTYDTDKVDELIAGAGGKYYLHRVYVGCANSKAFTVCFINKISTAYTFAEKTAFYDELERQFLYDAGGYLSTAYIGNFMDAQWNRIILLNMAGTINRNNNTINFVSLSGTSTTQSDSYIMQNMADRVIEL